jgi:hypothetical protein
MRKKRFPQRRKEAKVLSFTLSLRISFVPLRLCGNLYSPSYLNLTR